jgi:hypothetical protein
VTRQAVPALIWTSCAKGTVRKLGFPDPSMLLEKMVLSNLVSTVPARDVMPIPGGVEPVAPLLFMVNQWDVSHQRMSFPAVLEGAAPSAHWKEPGLVPLIVTWLVDETENARETRRITIEAERMVTVRGIEAGLSTDMHESTELDLQSNGGSQIQESRPDLHLGRVLQPD